MGNMTDLTRWERVPPLRSVERPGILLFDGARLLSERDGVCVSAGSGAENSPGQAEFCAGCKLSEVTNTEIINSEVAQA
jgi:hypothetical protein